MIAGTDKELKLLDKTSAEFAKKELWPNREENDKFPFGTFFDAVLKKACDLDFFHVILPENYGGIGHGMSALCIILSNICREDSSLGGIIFTHTAAQETILAAGAGDLLKKTISEAKHVKDFLIAFPVFNNPAEVPNIADAVKRNDTCVLSGSIEYLALGSIAGHALIPAKIKSKNGYLFFLVDLSDPGIEKSDPIMSLGLHACPAVDMVLNDVEATIIGSENAGSIYFEQMADKMYVAAAAMSAGIMKGSFSEAFEYCKGRQQGGREIINWSEVRMLLADMAVKVKNSEMIISRACQAVDSGEKEWQACASSAAIQIQENACNLTTDGIQVLGGVGYMKDLGQEKRFRDAKHIQALLGMAPMRKLRLIENMQRKGKGAK